MLQHFPKMKPLFDCPTNQPNNHLLQYTIDTTNHITVLFFELQTIPKNMKNQ